VYTVVINIVCTVVIDTVYYCIIQGAGLGAMASLLTYGNKKFESLDTQMRKLIPPLMQTVLPLTSLWYALLMC